MNWEQIEGKWEQVKGKVQEKWGKFTDNDIAVINGKKEQLIGKLESRYGYAKERAESEIDTFLRDCKCDAGDKAKSNAQSCM